MAQERRVVTVLFADVAGSTELGESLDPEDFRELLARFYEIAKDIVPSHGGTLEKFIGDAIMAVFGLPLAHGDDAERALAAALQLRDHVRGDALLGERLPLRIGVNTGEVVTTRDGSAGDFLVTGDAVNVAARLQQNAHPWQVLAGERTMRAARESFTFEPSTSLQTKGHRARVVAFPVVARLTRRRIRTPLVGRAADLGLLEHPAGGAFAEPGPQLASIVPPAGTGKTRLLEEFLDRLPRLAPDATVAVAQCLPYGQRLTYWPLRALLFSLVGIGDRASPRDVREAVRAWLEGSSVQKPDRVAELLAATVGAGEGEMTDRAALLAAWRTALEHAATRGPLVIVFEDLHWSSDSLLDLVEFVMQPRGDLAVLMIALTRPELLDRRPTGGGGRRNYVALALEPLSDDAVAELVGQLLESSSPEIVSRVVARADGNPFFAGELVRGLLDRVSSVDDQAAIDRALASLPDTVQATVLARLDLLEHAPRRVLQLGAVLGRTFRRAAVAALDPALGDVTPLLERLVDKDLVTPDGADAYVFRHILIREVAYQTLPRSERAKLHAAAGRWLEDFARGREDAFAELVAYHYREAALLTREDDPEARALRRSATSWSRRAAEVALAAAADLEAARHLEAAIELTDDELLPDLYERLGDARGYGDRAVAAYDRALTLARERGLSADRELRILAAGFGARLRFQGAMSVRESADFIAQLRASGRELLGGARDERAIAEFLIGDAFYTFWLLTIRQPTESELDECEESARRGLAIAERLGDERLMSAALDAVGSLHAQRGGYAASRAAARRRLAMRELPLTERLDAVAMATWMSTWLGELEDALRVSAEGLTIVQPGQVPAWVLHVLGRRLEALFLSGRWDEALATGDRSIGLWHESGEATALYALTGLVGALRVAGGRRMVAQRDRLREMLESITTRSAGAVNELWLSVIGQDADDIEKGLGRSANPNPVAHALSILCDLGRPPDAQLLQGVKARLLGVSTAAIEAESERCIGLASRDVAALTRALEAFSKMRAEPFVARVRCERALISGDAEDLEAGLAVLEALGDVEQVQRYERRRA